MLIEIYPSVVNDTNNYGNIPSLHYACINSATVKVIQLLLDQFTGQKQQYNGLNIADNHEQLLIHCYVCGRN
jgi:hypothetical protein